MVTPWTAGYAVRRQRAIVLVLLQRGVLDASPLRPEDVTPLRRRQAPSLAPLPVRVTAHD